jgi:acyl carrier protein
MEINEFIAKFQEQFIDADELSIKSDTTFRDLGTWDSLTGMAVLVMIKDDYGVDMTDTDLKGCQTVQNIFDFISSKTSSAL